LVAAGLGSAAASVLHLACIAGGPDWYRWLGAGEKMGRAAERGSWYPPLVACAIAAVLAVWSAYAFSAAGLMVRLPLARTALVLISAVLIARAALFFVRTSWRPDLSLGFMAWSSAIVLALGLVFAIGAWQAWSALTDWAKT
jgi:hypothetical protein